MSILSAGQFYGESSARREAAGITVSRLDHRCGRRLPLHVHEQPYFSMVLQGGYREESGRRSIEYDPLTIVYHPPGTAHLDEIGPRGARFLLIEAEEQFVRLEGVSEKLRSGHPTALPKRAGWLALQLLRGDDPFAQESIALALLAAVDETPIAGGAPHWLARVLERLREEFRSPPATGELAHSAGVHPVHLARVVRRETGMTLSDLVRHRRVEQAVGLMSSDESLASIALRTGFSDQAHLTRSFRSVTGMTPGELRRILC
ncbi:MAG TPA: AraC family transcriptional regulator [Thermoanaerobaculia bacterium]|nr:AraC family transcriptional regulator [Thermoanaerobaculia bacterium]